MKRKELEGLLNTHKLTNRQVRRTVRALEDHARVARKYAVDDYPDFAEPVNDRAEQAPTEEAGIVAEVRGDSCTLLFRGEAVTCALTGIGLGRGGEGLVVGDRVAFATGADGRPVATRALPRTSRLVRMRSDRTRRSDGGGAEHVLAANVDIAVIVASAASPAFHSRLVDRYLVMCQFGNVSPLLCLNKVDLADTLPDLSIYRDLGIPVVLASAAAGYGIAEMGEHLAGKTAVLTGHSGVGKSSLVNRLLGEDRERVGAVGGGGRGRHTTVASTLHVLERSTFVIDTPGIRSLGLWKIGRDELRYYFPEFANHADDCRFRDCLHRSEPGCAVIAAVARGELPTARYDSYLRLLSE